MLSRLKNLLKPAHYSKVQTLPSLVVRLMLLCAISIPLALSAGNFRHFHKMVKMELSTIYAARSLVQTAIS